MNAPQHAGQLAANLKPSAVAVAAPAVQVVEVDAKSMAVIDDLFERLKGMFPAWRQAWPTSAEFQAAKDEWIAEFIRSGIRSEEQIQHGVRMAAKFRSAFVPAVGVFIAWCFAPEAFGLPSLDKAYRIAMRNTHPAQAGMARWPHPAIYHAAVACGYLSLQRLDRKLGMQLFEEKYMDQCRKLGRGEVLAPAPVAELPAPMTKGSPEVAAAALAGLRQRLGVRRG